MIYAASKSSGPTAVLDMTLTCFAHPSTVVLSTSGLCDREDTHEKICVEAGHVGSNTQVVDG